MAAARRIVAPLVLIWAACAADESALEADGTPNVLPRSRRVDVTCGGRGEQMRYADVDAVVPAGHIVCTTPMIMRRLKHYMGVRSIYLITPASYVPKCRAIARAQPYVRCLDQDEVLPGVTYALLEANASAAMLAKKRVGWYLQQFLKLGAALHVRPLSASYLVWDSDNIALSGLRLRHNATHTALCVNDKRTSTWGGYRRFYTLLTGLPWKPPVPSRRGASRGPNYVCGYMMVERAVVRSLASHIDRRVFPWNVYKLANEYIGQKLHLSEYDTYGSWLTTHHPERVVAVRLPYERNPTALVTHARQSKVCCLSEATVCAFDARSWPRVPLLIWEEHKLRHRDKQCDDEDATAD